MGFLSNAMNSMSGMNKAIQTPNIDVAATPEQAQQAFANTQSGIDAQNQFLQAINAQNGIQNQGNVFNQQQALATQMQGVADGTGPNPAMAQLNQTTQQNVANQAALMAGQRGVGANAGLLARQAAMQGGALQQQAVGQGATMAANQQIAGMQALSGQQAQMGNTAQNQVGNTQGAITGLNNAASAQQGNVNSAIAAQNATRAGVANNLTQSNMAKSAANAKLIGDVVTGAGKAAAGMPPMNKGGMVQPQRMAEGGEVSDLITPENIMKIAPMLAGAPPMPMAQGGAVPAPAPMSFGQYMMADGGAVPATAPKASTPSTSAPKPDAPKKAPKAAEAPTTVEYAPMPKMPMVHALSEGGPVPGTPKVKGDSLKNDTVPTLLSPGEIVIPKSIVEGKNPGDAAKKFVEAIMAKNGSMPKAPKGKK